MTSVLVTGAARAMACVFRGRASAGQKQSGELGNGIGFFWSFSEVLLYSMDVP